MGLSNPSWKTYSPPELTDRNYSTQDRWSCGPWLGESLLDEGVRWLFPLHALQIVPVVPSCRRGGRLPSSAARAPLHGFQAWGLGPTKGSHKRKKAEGKTRNWRSGFGTHSRRTAYAGAIGATTGTPQPRPYLRNWNACVRCSTDPPRARKGPRPTSQLPRAAYMLTTLLVNLLDTLPTK